MFQVCHSILSPLEEQSYLKSIRSVIKYYLKAAQMQLDSVRTSQQMYPAINAVRKSNFKIIINESDSEHTTGNNSNYEHPEVETERYEILKIHDEFKGTNLTSEVNGTVLKKSEQPSVNHKDINDFDKIETENATSKGILNKTEAVTIQISDAAFEVKTELDHLLDSRTDKPQEDIKNITHDNITEYDYRNNDIVSSEPSFGPEFREAEYSTPRYNKLERQTDKSKTFSWRHNDENETFEVNEYNYNNVYDTKESVKESLNGTTINGVKEAYIAPNLTLAYLQMMRDETNYFPPEEITDIIEKVKNFNLEAVQNYTDKEPVLQLLPNTSLKVSPLKVKLHETTAESIVVYNSRDEALEAMMKGTRNTESESSHDILSEDIFEDIDRFNNSNGNGANVVKRSLQQNIFNQVCIVLVKLIINNNHNFD